MSILSVFAVRDRAVDSFGQPIFATSEGGVIRSFRDEIANPESPFSKHPDDYDLYRIGTYDQESGALVGCDPVQVAIGKSLVPSS